MHLVQENHSRECDEKLLVFFNPIHEPLTTSDFDDAFVLNPELQIRSNLGLGTSLTSLSSFSGLSANHSTPVMLHNHSYYEADRECISKIYTDNLIAMKTSGLVIRTELTNATITNNKCSIEIASQSSKSVECSRYTTTPPVIQINSETVVPNRTSNSNTNSHVPTLSTTLTAISSNQCEANFCNQNHSRAMLHLPQHERLSSASPRSLLSMETLAVPSGASTAPSDDEDFYSNDFDVDSSSQNPKTKLTPTTSTCRSGNTLMSFNLEEYFRSNTFRSSLDSSATRAMCRMLGMNDNSKSFCVGIYSTAIPRSYSKCKFQYPFHKTLKTQMRFSKSISFYLLTLLLRSSLNFKLSKMVTRYRAGNDKALNYLHRNLQQTPIHSHLIIPLKRLILLKVWMPAVKPKTCHIMLPPLQLSRLTDHAFLKPVDFTVPCHQLSIVPIESANSQEVLLHSPSVIPRPIRLPNPNTYEIIQMNSSIKGNCLLASSSVERLDHFRYLPTPLKNRNLEAQIISLLQPHPFIIK